MPLILNGSTGISGTDGSAGTPALQGTDGNTGMFFPTADQIAFAEGGVEAMRLDASGNVGIGTTAPTARLDVNGSIVAGTANGVSMFVPVNSAIRDTASTGSTMFFDVATGGATHGAFNFRSSNSFTSRMVVASNGDLQFNSGYGSVATAYGCRAWVNFNGTGVIAIRGSGNVSSIGRNGTGDYTVNLATAMPDANYAVVVLAGDTGQTFGLPVQVSRASGSYRFRTTNTSDTSQDSAFVNVVIFR